MKDTKKKAGVLIISRATGRILLLLRCETATYPLTWSMVAGHIQEGEDILDGLKRELNEETGINPDLIDFYFIASEKKHNFHYYIGFIDTEIPCKLDNENLNYGWFNKDNLPTPLFPGLDEKIKVL